MLSLCFRHADSFWIQTGSRLASKTLPGTNELVYLGPNHFRTGAQPLQSRAQTHLQLLNGVTLASKVISRWQRQVLHPLLPPVRLSLSSFSTAARTTRNKETRAAATPNNIRHERRARQNHNHCHRNNNHHNHHNSQNLNHNNDNSHNNQDKHHAPYTSDVQGRQRDATRALRNSTPLPHTARPQDTFEDTERGGIAHCLRDPARRGGRPSRHVGWRG